MNQALALRDGGHRNIVGVVSADSVTGEWPYLGQLDVFPEVVEAGGVTEVAMCLGADDGPALERIVRFCAHHRVRLSVPIPLDLRSTSNDLQRSARRVKRAMDVVGSVLGLILLAPLLFVTAIAILLIDGRPILFQQERAGYAGRSFRMWKFRTMRHDAEGHRSELRAVSEVRGAAFKMDEDPRITPFGRWLRRSSIDELPQLWNVLMGHMSLVGPRPHAWDDVVRYRPWHLRRLSVKPGITGLWQVELRREPDFDRWVARDIDYLERWSIWFDVQLIARTFGAVVRGTGR